MMTEQRLQRWGVVHSDGNQRTHAPMPDGYWTPWHLADAEVRRLQQQIIEMKEAEGECAADTLATCEQRDAALAERDDARADRDALLEDSKLSVRLLAALTEARRVLREVRELFPDTGTPDPDHSVALYYGQVQQALAAVLAQDESAD